MHVTHASSSINSGVISIGTAAAFPQLQIVPGRTWLIELPVILQVCIIDVAAPSSPHSFCRFFVQASLDDGLLGVAAPSISEISLIPMQPSVTFQDSPNALLK